MFFPSYNEASQNRDHGPVHSHGNRHFIQRNTIEQDLHIFDTVNRHTGLANVANNTRVVTIVAPMRRQIEGDRHTFLPRSQTLAVKRIAVFSRRETGILPDGPRPPCIHRAARATRIGRNSGHSAKVLNPVQIVRCINRLNGDPLRRIPRQIIERAATEFFFSEGFPIVRIIAHGSSLYRFRGSDRG